jgi:lipoate-protein ligase B
MDICEVHLLGLVPYKETWELQNHLATEIAAGERSPTLLVLEHPHTYTFGRRGNATNLLWDEAELAQRGVAVHWVDRGGDVTYHGPGQLVGYPLLPLGRVTSSGDGTLPKADYVGYIRKLEQVIIATVAKFGVKGQSMEGLTGVWVSREQKANNHQVAIAKLAAIGVKVDAHGVTRHGFAINVNPNMHYWEGILGCGLEYPEISLSQILDEAPPMTRIQETLIRAFGKIFEYQMHQGISNPDLSFGDHASIARNI